MAAEPSTSAPPALRPGWSAPKPDKLPAPSIWPATLAGAIMLLVWGLVTSLIISGVAILLLALALAGWIQAIRYERSKH